MKKTNNHIEEYFLKSEGNSKDFASKELFKDENIEVRTDINNNEIILINKLIFNDDFLLNKGLNPVFKKFYKNLMKLKISKDRKSRQEFVSINKEDKTDDVLNGMGNISNILNTRK